MSIINIYLICFKYNKKKEIIFLTCVHGRLLEGKVTFNMSLKLRELLTILDL